MSESRTKDVRRFYDQVGWQVEADGWFQNARYEDLRQVSSEYIHRCHMRVKRFIAPEGNLLLDAGSGPLQYPEYLTYSLAYRHRVCVDLSIVALREARQRIGQHGFFVVGDVANLPFKPNLFDGLVSLHTLHHLTLPDQKKSFEEFNRVLKKDANAVVVNGWMDSTLMQFFQPAIRFAKWMGKRISGRERDQAQQSRSRDVETNHNDRQITGTFIEKLDAQSLKKILQPMDFEIRCWRSVSVRFLRAMIHKSLGGRLALRLIFSLEELFPRFFGEKGQYPLVIIHKT